jgi:hypothetical protein
MLNLNKQNANNKSGHLTPADAPFETALILICEKCGKNQGKHFAREVQQELKKTFRGEGVKEKFRAVLTGCLDLCPDHEVTIGISRTKGENQFFTASGEPEEIARAVWEAVRKK